MKISDLPRGFPSIIIHHCDADRREPGYMLVSLGKGVRAISDYSDDRGSYAEFQNAFTGVEEEGAE